MRIIISHDIDHLSVREHIFKDLIVPKYIIWSLLELVKTKISFKTFLLKIIGLFKKNAWNNLEELLEFDKLNGVRPTFFVAVNNGKGLSYPLQRARGAIELIKKYNFDVGVHGICFNDYGGIKKEYEDFKSISSLNDFGIRMHYLRLKPDTLGNLARAGYLFDTTILSNDLDQEYKINEMTEFPFHLMEGRLLGPRGNLSLEQVRDTTIKLFEEAERGNKKYLAILFHQNYFGDQFPYHKNWYIWLINYCKEKGYQFVDYKGLLKGPSN